MADNAVNCGGGLDLETSKNKNDIVKMSFLFAPRFDLQTPTAFPLNSSMSLSVFDVLQAQAGKQCHVVPPRLLAPRRAGRGRHDGQRFADRGFFHLDLVVTDRPGFADLFRLADHPVLADVVGPADPLLLRHADFFLLRARRALSAAFAA